MTATTTTTTPSTTATPFERIGKIAKSRARRVTFDGLDFDQERKKSERGHRSRKLAKELRMERRQQQQEDEEDEEKMKREMSENYQILMNPHFEQKLVDLAKGKSDHKDITPQSKGEFQVFLIHFLQAAGAPNEKKDVTKTTEMTIQEKLVWLRNKNRPFEELLERELAGITLNAMGRNKCFRKHYKFISEPPSDSETSANSRLKRGIEKPGARAVLRSDHFPGTVPSLVEPWLQFTKSLSSDDGDKERVTEETKTSESRDEEAVDSNGPEERIMDNRLTAVAGASSDVENSTKLTASEESSLQDSDDCSTTEAEPPKKKTRTHGPSDSGVEL